MRRFDGRRAVAQREPAHRQPVGRQRQVQHARRAVGIERHGAALRLRLD